MDILTRLSYRFYQLLLYSCCFIILCRSITNLMFESWNDNILQVIILFSISMTF
jgi:hypothetical protein